MLVFHLKDSSSLIHFRHVGHVGWDPKGGFDVRTSSFIQSQWDWYISNVITQGMTW